MIYVNIHFFSLGIVIVWLILCTMFSDGQAREAATTFQGKLVDAQRRKGKGSLLMKLVVAFVDAALILPSLEASDTQVFRHSVLSLAVTIRLNILKQFVLSAH